MFLSNAAGYFVLFALFTACVGCGFWQDKAEPGTSIASTEARVTPFSTKEPETYQAEIVITAGGIERRIFTARKGAMRRVDYDFGTSEQKTFLQSEGDYVVSDALKIYAAKSPGKEMPGSTELENDVTDNLLNRRHDTNFENLGRENGISRFRAVPADSDSSESIIFVNDVLGLPVRQEFYSIDPAGQRMLQYTSELRDVRLDVDDALFTVPAKFRKVSMIEFSRMTRLK